MADDKKKYQKNVNVRKPDKSGSDILSEGLRAMAITYGTGLGAMVGLGGYATGKELVKVIKDKKKKEKDRKAFEDKIRKDVRKKADDAMSKARKKHGLPPLGSDPKEFKIKGGSGPKGKRLKRI
tara:strand:+ start:53 stop:424 length:372 start_codon:yes stop_codon:yes gene_type:complete